jgi:hypothetical protein
LDAFFWACGEAHRLDCRLVVAFVTARGDVTSSFAAIGGAGLNDLAGDRSRELARLTATRHADTIVVGRSEKVWHHLAGSLGRHLAGLRNAPVIVVP